MRKKLLGLVIGSLCFAAPAAAQSDREALLEQAAQIRAMAQQLSGAMPPAEIAKLMADADKLEAEARASTNQIGYEKLSPINQHIADVHGGHFDWLKSEKACDGFTWMNYHDHVIRTGPMAEERTARCRAYFADDELWIRNVDNWTADKGDKRMEHMDREGHAIVADYERALAAK